MFDARVLKVLISTPGDTGPEVTAVTDALHKWNADRAESARVVLLPRFWKSHAVPLAGGNGQTVINSQLVDDADIVLAFFDSKLGQETADAVSGTAHEIDRKTKDGSPVHVYFSSEERKLVGNAADIQRIAAEVQRLEDYQKQLGDVALYGSYKSPEHLAEQIRSAIEQDVQKFATSASPHSAAQTGSTAKDVALLEELLGEWQLGGRMREHLRVIGEGMKVFRESHVKDVQELNYRFSDDPRSVKNARLKVAYDDLKVATRDYATCMGRYLFREEPGDFLRLSSETPWDVRNEQENELGDSQNRFEDSLETLISVIHDVR